MKKRIKKHIENQNFVKVYLTDRDDLALTHFAGIIFEQTDKFILMNDMTDFFFDGFIILRKSDVSEIKHTENEKFFKTIIDQEKITDLILERREHLNFSLDNFFGMFTQLHESKLAIILECIYGEDERFQIGPVYEVGNKKVKLRYFNANGDFDLKPVSVKYKDITFVRFDSPYTNTFFKYAVEVE